MSTQRSDLRFMALQVADLGAPRRGWADDAACRTMPKDLFFTDNGGLGYGHEVRRACAGCPVRVDCLAECTQLPYGTDLHGFRGGFGPKERRTLRALVREFGRVAS